MFLSLNKTRFYFVCDVRNYLHRCAKIVAFALFLDNGLINASRGNVAYLRKVCVNKSFIVSQIEVGFGAVIGYKYFAVLERTHRSRVNVYIRVKFLYGNGKSSCSQKFTERCSDYSFSKRTYNTARYKNILCHS